MRGALFDAVAAIVVLGIEQTMRTLRVVMPCMPPIPHRPHQGVCAGSPPCSHTASACVSSPALAVSVITVVSPHRACTAGTATEHRRSRAGLCVRPVVPRRSRLSRRFRELIRGLDRPTVGGLVVDDDRGSRIELVPDLPDFDREWDFVDTVVGPLARDERFNDAAQSFRAQHAVRNHHSRDAYLLWTGPPSERSGPCRHSSSGWMDPRHALRSHHASLNL